MTLRQRVEDELLNIEREAEAAVNEAYRTGGSSELSGRIADRVFIRRLCQRIRGVLEHHVTQEGES